MAPLNNNTLTIAIDCFAKHTFWEQFLTGLTLYIYQRKSLILLLQLFLKNKYAFFFFGAELYQSKQMFGLNKITS